MTISPLYPVLQFPMIRSCHKHIIVIITFHNYYITIFKIFSYKIGNTSNITSISYFFIIKFKKRLPKGLGASFFINRLLIWQGCNTMRQVFAPPTKKEEFYGVKQKRTTARVALFIVSNHFSNDKVWSFLWKSCCRLHRWVRLYTSNRLLAYLYFHTYRPILRHSVLLWVGVRSGHRCSFW